MAFKGGKFVSDDFDLSHRILEDIQKRDTLDSKLGIPRLSVDRTVGWLYTVTETSVELSETSHYVSAVECFFMRQNGSLFKISYPFRPYFLIRADPSQFKTVEGALSKQYGKQISSTEVVIKDDLSTPNHLSGIKTKFIQVTFHNQRDMQAATRELRQIARRYQTARGVKTQHRPATVQTALATFDDPSAGPGGRTRPKRGSTVPMATRAPPAMLEGVLQELVEYDVPYVTRALIDTGVRCSAWYDVEATPNSVTLEHRADLAEKPGNPRVLAFDIETTKQPLRFPDAEGGDEVMMISYMLDEQGFLIVNRAIVSEDIQNFEYTPKPEYYGPFHVFNEPDEAALLRRFFDHCRECSPNVYVTFNGDFFDWPFIEIRARQHGMDMRQEIGVYSTVGHGRSGSAEAQYSSNHAPHLDCFKWVKRDSYLPQGSQGLKAVTRAKLHYDPMELDPEDMMPFARTHPHILASYSVSDAVATFYLFRKYVQPFIFALCTILPLPPDDVLRKGTGTLCESLLMVTAFEAKVPFPQKMRANALSSYNNKVLDSQTYVGGRVEALHAGVWRSDLEYDFDLSSEGYQTLIDKLRDDLIYCLTVEEKLTMDKVVDFEEKMAEIQKQLEHIRDNPKFRRRPLIYHLDVGAMYPNIMLTNRLQPPAIVDAAVCAACDFAPTKSRDNRCQRRMEWVWRGTYFPLTPKEVRTVRGQLEAGKHPLEGREELVPWDRLPEAEQSKLIKAELGRYSSRNYKKIHESEELVRTACVCQRENPFYIDTVRKFRDRRYIYKGRQKACFGRMRAAMEALQTETDPAERTRLQREHTDAEVAYVLNESLQLAHKAILNTFYGYVMRKGSRWYSMEMAGAVTNTGGEIIKAARRLVAKVGIPLELDTDGIWCAMPTGFPEEVTFQLRGCKKKSVRVSYPAVMLNADCVNHFTNDQYQDWDPETNRYTTKSECSIYFEVDGPYKAMILSAAAEEGKRIKKRYAVFNPNGSLAELKGFELKRRGELQLIKDFQSRIFKSFLLGTTIEETFAACARIADVYLDVLFTKGHFLSDRQLLALIVEGTTMRKTVADYGAQKSLAITTVKRLAEFLDRSYLTSTGLACRFIISRLPDGASITERAIPVQVFQTPLKTQRRLLARWTKDISFLGATERVDIRSIIDWQYYISRLSGTVIKIVVVPAGLQGLNTSPVTRVPFPEWLAKKAKERTSTVRQTKIDSFFKISKKRVAPAKAVPRQHRPAPVPEAKPTPHNYRKTHGPAPSRSEDFLGWLEWMKGFWALQRQARKEGRISSTLRADAGVRMFGGVKNDVDSAPLRIIRVDEQLSGSVRVWVAAGDNPPFSLRKFVVDVPRVYYVNTSASQQQLGVSDTPNSRGMLLTLSRRHLPRSHPRRTLVRYQMPESLFRATTAERALVRTHPDVLGVYETGITPQLRFMMSVPNVCRVKGDSESQKRARSSRLHMADLDGCQGGYLLNDSHVSCHTTYMLVGIQGSRGIILLLSPSRLHVIIVGASGKFLSPQSLKRLQHNMTTSAEQNLTAVRESDLGGLEAEEFSNPTESLLAPSAHVSNEGVYRSVCITLSLGGLLPSTLAAAAAIGVHQPKMSTEDAAHLDPETSAAGQLQAVGALVRSMFKKRHALMKGCPSGSPRLSALNHLLESLDRYISSPAALLYDSGLHRRTARLVQRSFERLIDVFRGHGFSVITGRIRELLLASSRLDPELAEQQLTHALDEVNREPGFKQLRLHQRQIYRSVLFLDEQNWFGVQAVTGGGAPGAPGAGTAVGTTLEELPTPAAEGLTLLGTWNQQGLGTILEQTQPGGVGGRTKVRRVCSASMPLPALLRPRFDQIVSFFLQRPLIIRQALDHEEGRRSVFADMQRAIQVNARRFVGVELPAALQASQRGGYDEMGLDVFDITSAEHWPSANSAQEALIAAEDKLKAIMRGYDPLASRPPPALSRATQELQHARYRLEFFRTREAGLLKNLEHVPPKLYFVRTLCRFLDLDKPCSAEVITLRRSLMRLINVGEYSQLAAFKHPIRPFVLRNVPCHQCAVVSDLDLTRDPNLFGEWRCHFCRAFIRKDHIEWSLVTLAQRLSSLYQLQDAVCNQCGKLRTTTMVSNCSCQGSFRNRMSADTMIHNMELLRIVSTLHDMPLLNQTVDLLSGHKLQ
eukprot:gnl/Dysnectes_brevis/3887_a5028_282.p1 GENE.gnl/Dysnectes_brevis/3887_a5028_282~~gnl/Dysnectes_brevis/3887_a5028_282.p1  ORF type:complete len:2152 (+),score=783.83 gnl/Dysnectes_brevis/3887_a5028_282:42-6497(+)